MILDLACGAEFASADDDDDHSCLHKDGSCCCCRCAGGGKVSQDQSDTADTARFSVGTNAAAMT